MPEFAHPIPFEIDHVIARKHEGQTVASNLALSCFNCNSYKGPNIAGVDHASGDIVRLFHPRSDSWDEHFRWEEAQLVGKTAIARAKIHVLSINHPDHIALRLALMEEGIWPVT